MIKLGSTVYLRADDGSFVESVVITAQASHVLAA